VSSAPAPPSSTPGRSGFRTVLVVAAVVAAAFGYVQLAEHKGYALQKGSVAPPLRLPTLAGGERDLDAERGKLVVLNFWATWCPPCVAEMPSLERLQQALAADGLSVVAVSTDVDAAAPRRFVADHRLTLRVLHDPGGRVATSAFRITGYPETYLIDRDGHILQHVVGPAEWDSPVWLARFRGLLGADAPAR
jgi:thiol-disulfide isomerase/thioredoxin